MTHKRGYRPGALRFHRDGKQAPVHLKLRVAEDEEDYPLVLAAPEVLAANGIGDLILLTFKRILSERRWLFPDML